MTNPTPTEPEKKFTQADLDRVVADRLARERTKYADYDELKQQAQAAAGSKSQLDKIQDQLDKAEKRAEKAEGLALRSSVAAELGLSEARARRLTGATRDELLADGRQMIEDFGLKPKGGAESDADGDDDGKRQDGEGAGNDDGKQQDGKDDAPAQRAPRTRPRELRSGAAMSEPQTEEMDPRKLAESVGRRF
jgi:hypothetical protein